MSDAFTKFLEEQGITWETTAPRTPQQNGVAECMNQTLIGGARALLHHSGMTTGFWAEAIAVAVHSINCAPRKCLGWRTPFELLYGRIPDISYFRTFGCRAWVYNDKGKKWDTKSKPMIFIGYKPGTKAYRLWNPATRSVVISANVQFNEHKFPYRPETSPSVPQPTSSAPPVASSSRTQLPPNEVELPQSFFDEIEVPKTCPTPLSPPHPIPIISPLSSFPSSPDKSITQPLPPSNNSTRPNTPEPEPSTPLAPTVQCSRRK